MFGAYPEEHLKGRLQAFPKILGHVDIAKLNSLLDLFICHEKRFLASTPLVNVIKHLSSSLMKRRSKLKGLSNGSLFHVRPIL